MLRNKLWPSFTPVLAVILGADLQLKRLRQSQRQPFFAWPSFRPPFLASLALSAKLGPNSLSSSIHPPCPVPVGPFGGSFLPGHQQLFVFLGACSLFSCCCQSCCCFPGATSCSCGTSPALLPTLSTHLLHTIRHRRSCFARESCTLFAKIPNRTWLGLLSGLPGDFLGVSRMTPNLANFVGVSRVAPTLAKFAGVFRMTPNLTPAA